MATLVLTTIGSVVGGPVGGAIGALIGNAIDRDVLFRPKGREGPRLSELALQTSSYGTPIARVFGTMRIGGCVIWSTDLIESRSTSRSGKGQPSVSSFSYAASFAVALSGRPIHGVGRIWADGKLLRGAAGDFKSATGFRLHRGDENQPVDPLIGSAEGIALTPAHRGIAYAVFEQFQLADYGNRIPSLTFEVIADDTPVATGAIAAALSDGMIDGSTAAEPIAGFAAYGDSVRAAVEALAVVGGARFMPDGAGLRMRSDRVVDATLDDRGVRAAGGSAETGDRAIAALESIPRQLSIAHYDPARDYQTGSQRATRPGPGGREERIELPVAIDARGAKTLAEAALARAEAGRERRRVALGWDALAVRPGACVTIAGVSGIWRVAGWALEHMVVSLDCVRLPGGDIVPGAASAGRVAPAPDLATGTTILAAFEMLPLDDVLLGAPRLTVVAAGTAPGWRRAALLISSDGGAHWTPAGATAAAGTIGTVVAPPGQAGAAILDLATHLVVDLVQPAMALAGADDRAIADGANLALVGDELLQFGRADQIGPVRWRLSRLARGRRGTEAAIGQASVGDRFVLIDGDSVATIDLPQASPGQDVRLIASGAGDPDPVTTTISLGGASIVPPAPVQLSARAADDGTVLVQWVRRSRNGWRWVDGVDAPLGEEALRFRVTILPGDGAGRVVDVSEAALLVAATDRAGGARLEIRQVGAYGESPPATIDLPSL